MKHTICSIFVFFFLNPCFSQNIIHALRLQEDFIGKYTEGEHQSTDTIIDLRNGYYEEFYADKNDNYNLTLRQAAIFNNVEGTQLLGITVCIWDFVCFQSNTSFYEISKSRKSIKPINLSVILPQLTYQDFLQDISLLSDLKEYMSKQSLADADSYDDFDEYLNESGVFDIKYSLPRKGTSVIASIGACDYYIDKDKWSRLKEKYFTEVALKYNSNLKRFENPNKK